MLTHQRQQSEGAGIAGVNINDGTIANIRILGTCHSGIRVGSDGVLYKVQENGGFSSISGEWLITGTASDFYVQRTIISGTLEDDPGTGFLQCNANRDYVSELDSQGVKLTEIFIEFSSDVSGVPIVATATYNFQCTQGSS